jgi:DNA/RNA endonuclease G (NUC1)
LLPQGPVPEAFHGDVERTAEKVVRGDALDSREGFILEAIIIPDKRPAVAIVKGDYRVEHPMWMHLNGDAPKKAIRPALPSIGRVELPGHPSGRFGGTGFVVGRNLLMTNRHVAEIFCEGLGRRGLVFRQDHAAGVDFDRELGGGSLFLAVRAVAMIHPYWDMALLEVEGLPAAIAPLRLSTAEPQSLEGRDVAVIGYPAFDPRNNTAVQNQVFGEVYDVKRLMPGKLTGRSAIRSFGKDVACSLHDSSTLGGASGSAVLDAATGEVVALHFAGIYLKSNYGVPTADLARDRRVIDAGVNFAGKAAPGAGPWDEWWAQAEANETPGIAVGAAGGTGGTGTAAASVVLQSPGGGSGGGGARWTIPIEISIEVGAPQAAAPAPAAQPVAAEAATEKAVEPFHEADYGDRRGYDPDFLGVPAPLPDVTDRSVLARLEDGSTVVPYHHFSVMMHRRRRLAIVTAANVDASPQRRRPEPGRDYGRKPLAGLGENDMERWFTDPRLRGSDQLPDRFFEKDGKAFDKGHLVRRDDVAWGDTYEELRAANGDSFHTTNCSPQVGGFNRSNLHGAWGELENHILKQAKSQRLSYFAGPVLAESDRASPASTPGQGQVQIPEEYWKLVLAVDDGRLRAFAFVLRQDVSDLPLEFQVDAEVAAAHGSIARSRRSSASSASPTPSARRISSAPLLRERCCRRWGRRRSARRIRIEDAASGG